MYQSTSHVMLLYFSYVVQYKFTIKLQIISSKFVFTGVIIYIEKTITFYADENLNNK